MTVTERILTIAVVVLGTVTTRFLPFEMCIRDRGGGV